MILLFLCLLLSLLLVRLILGAHSRLDLACWALSTLVECFHFESGGPGSLVRRAPYSSAKSNSAVQGFRGSASSEDGFFDERQESLRKWLRVLNFDVEVKICNHLSASHPVFHTWLRQRRIPALVGCSRCSDFRNDDSIMIIMIIIIIMIMIMSILVFISIIIMLFIILLLLLLLL